MKRLVKMEIDCGRMGDLDGMFVLDADGWARLRRVIDEKTDVNFGEVLGKHSEIYGEIPDSAITVVTEDQAWLDRAAELGVNLSSGYNPLDYLTCDECYNVEEDCDCAESGEGMGVEAPL